ncbi:hypothetical protein ACIPWL_01920 [Streptomyces sp. NPDC090023]|uniref:hypothetical protein n=1 Tax=unclassified Streptomyces TaxID=2593676 RepID=UPI003809FBC4
MASRHARAHAVEVVLRVADDGVGIPSGGRLSGLRNMAERGEQLGGRLELGGAESGGAVLVWTVPLTEGA